MKDVVELEEGDLRIFTLDQITSNGSRSSGRLYCGFCGEHFLIRSWYPASSDLQMQDKVKLEHFQTCPNRGAVNSFDLAVFDGAGEPTRVRITI